MIGENKGAMVKLYYTSLLQIYKIKFSERLVKNYKKTLIKIYKYNGTVIIGKITTQIF